MALASAPGHTPTAAEIRLVNGSRIIIIAFVTILIAFVAVMICYTVMNAGVTDEKGLLFPRSDILGVLGAMTSVVGTLVGSYFGVSSANGARDAVSKQAQSVNDVAQRMLGQLPPDAAKKVTG